MKSYILSLIRQYLFWMFFFFLIRLVFILYYIPLLRWESVPFWQVMSTFYHALLLDTATACYILILPLLIITFQSAFGARWLNYANKTYTYLLVFVFSFITSVELGSFGEWKSKLSAKTIAYGHHPKEAFQSISLGEFLSLLGILVGLVAISVLIYNRIFYRNLTSRARRWFLVPVFFVLSGGIMFLGIRGGTGPIPISQSAAYFSRHSILNWASVNSGFNLAASVLESMKFDNRNPFEFYDLNEAKEQVNELYKVEKDTTIKILNTSRPNIVILLMESWSGDLIESLGGEPGITPQFAELEKGGVLFTHFYASGNRSQQAMANIFAGYPSLPYTTITENPEKYTKLPSMVKLLNSFGYHSSFYFGGQLIYGNIKAYILFNQFQKIVEEADIDRSIPRGRLGVHDEYLLGLQADHLADEQQPFFSVAFTLSSHSPYDQPMEPVLDWGGHENPYINSAYYSDRSLGEYFEKARQMPWYDSTLFIIVADHSHNSYRNWPLETFEYHKIPLLLYGNAIKEEWRGKKLDRISSNIDITSTLLHQLDLENLDFPWSKDLFNPYTPEFAFFEINDGVGWKTPEGEFVYNVRTESYPVLKMSPGTSEEDKEQLIHQGKSYIQALFQQFMDM